MGLLDNLERKIEKAVRKPFNGRGGSLQPVELASALRNEVDRSIVSVRDRSIAPNDVSFRFGAQAYLKAYEWGQPLADELCGVLIRHARSQGYTLPADVIVRFHQDAALEEHEFAVDTIFTDEDGEPLNLDHGHSGGSHSSKAPQREVRAAVPIPDPEPQAPKYQGVVAVGGQRYAIEGESVIIGRSQSADIRVTDSGVSRNHVEIRVHDGAFWARDMGSTNGTFLNGFPLLGEEELTDGSLLTLSGTRITFRLVEAEQEEEAPGQFGLDPVGGNS